MVDCFFLFDFEAQQGKTFDKTHNFDLIFGIDKGFQKKSLKWGQIESLKASR